MLCVACRAQGVQDPNVPQISNQWGTAVQYVVCTVELVLKDRSTEVENGLLIEVVS